MPRPFPALLVLAASLGLAGCGGGLLRGGGAEAPTEVAVTTDAIVVTGPDGYCIDPTATRDTGATGFVLLGNCAAIANSRRVIQPATPAVLTAAISEPSSGGRLADSIAELDAFFRSDEGLTLLSRSGDPATVTILDTALDGEVFLLHAADTSEGAIDGVQADYWRAYLDVGPRIATLSVLALEDRALSREESLATLRGFAAAVQAANPAPGATPLPPPGPVAPVQAAPQNLPLGAGPLWNVGLFRRIFG
ncbi:hypothetical protein [Roseicyclus persicicus]|uniref:Uncharacterized protein n=1 Tax=Roseicyclus persicicus TaxID=2650661 RepID=A0A7X6H055_9RHOB|nr:hypothetical protein [Roseibacterium persicicum]NKX44944.1 hypothetical protein [Roseibacterium persicicum]